MTQESGQAILNATALCLEQSSLVCRLRGLWGLEELGRLGPR